MGFKDKKMAVLDRLRLEQEAIGLKELLKKLGSGYVERSVRRWLVEMEKEGLVERFGQKRSTKYRIKPYSKKYASCFGPESKKIITQLERPLYERNPITYVDSWFEAYSR